MPDQLRRKRKQCHVPRALDGPLGLSLAAGTVAAALAIVYLAAVGQKLRKSLDVFVVDVLYPASAKTTLSLITSSSKTRLSPVAGSATFFRSTFLSTSL